MSACACFFLLPYILYPQLPKDIPAPALSKHILVQAIAIDLFLVGFYYLNTLLLIPKLLFRRKWFLYILLIISSFAAFFYIPKQVSHWITGNDEEIIHQEFVQMRAQQRSLNDSLSPKHSQQRPPRSTDTLSRRPRQHPAELTTDTSKHDTSTLRSDDPRRNGFRRRPGNGVDYFPGSYALFILVFAIGTFIAVMQQWLKTEHTRQQIEHEKINTELSFLRSQVNPHFFFNTLNNIYSLAITGSQDTAPAVMKLSSIMRYILTETEANLVPLQNEIDFLRNFIDLQLVRLTDKVEVNFTAEGNTENKQVAPLLFIPFVENAFKYGVSTKERSAIKIKITSSADHILLDVSNTLVKADNGIHETTGIGINNVKRRLQLLYPGKHNLTVKEEDNQFKVHLDIHIK